MKFLIVLISFISLAVPQPGGYRLTVRVNNIKPVKGELYIALYNRPEYFNNPDNALMKNKVMIDAESETIVFDNVPAGKYALAVYQDENLNGELDVNDLGIPKEGYAFSGKPKSMGEPKFEEAAFEVSGNDTVILKMVYHPVPPPKKEGDKK
jgi:uncharacterized protein (DUF2141 family)